MWGWGAWLWTSLKSLVSIVWGADQIKEVRDKTVELCGFLPTIASVSAMVTANNPAVVGGAAVAMAICKALKSTQYGKVSYSGYEQPTVNGVVIEGDYQDGRVP